MLRHHPSLFVCCVLICDLTVKRAHTVRGTGSGPRSQGGTVRAINKLTRNTSNSMCRQFTFTWETDDSGEKRLAAKSAVMFSFGIVVFLECLPQPQRAPLGFTERVNGLLFFFFFGLKRNFFFFLRYLRYLWMTTNLYKKKKKNAISQKQNWKAEVWFL